MKKIIFSFVFIFYSVLLFSQSVGDYRSTNGGNWSNPSIWEICSSITPVTWVAVTTEGYPGELGISQKVTIQDGHSVIINITPANQITDLNIGTGASGSLTYLTTATNSLQVVNDVTINTGAVFASSAAGSIGTNSLSVGGNLVNNGTLDFWTGAITRSCNITFIGAVDKSFSCGVGSTTDLYLLTLDKTGATLDFNPDGTTLTVKGVGTTGFLIITGGTFKISGTGTFSNKLFSTVTIPANGGLWMNNANFTVVGVGTITCGGDLRVSNGTLNVGTTGAHSLTFNNSASKLTIDGGTINISGKLHQTAPTTFIMSSGNISVSTAGNSTAPASFNLSSSSNSITISGGNINLEQRSTLDYDVNGSSVNITGGSLNVGTASTATNFNFKIQGYIPNLSIFDHASSISATIGTASNIYGDISINQGNTLNFNNQSLTFCSTNSNQTITNNSGSISGTVNVLTIDNTFGAVTLNNPITAATLTLANGLLNTTTANLLTVSGSTVASVTGGSTTSYVSGPLCRTIPSGASSANYLFPVGKSSYHLYEMLGLTTGGSGTGKITIEAFEAGTTGTGTLGLKDPLAAENIYWEYKSALSSVTISTVSSVRLTANYTAIPTKAVGMSTAATHNGGTYISIGSDSGNPIQSILTINPVDLFPATTRYFTIAEATPLIGTYTVGAVGKDYVNLTSISNDLRIKSVIGNVTFVLQSDYEGFPGGLTPETFPVVFTPFIATDPSYTVTIRLADGLTNRLTNNGAATISTSLIQLDGIDNFILDGQGRTGAGVVTGVNEWTFSVKTNTNNVPTFLFQNDVTNNTLEYLNIEGNSTDAGTFTNATLIIGTTTGTTGNTDNTITYCNIRDNGIGTPTNSILSLGTSSKNNSRISITNNNISNFFNDTQNTTGIYIGANSTDFTISGNKIFQTASRVFTSGSPVYRAIYVNTSSATNFEINDNIIGYSSAIQSGFTDISGSTCEFAGIEYNVSNGTTSNMLRNTFSGIKFATSSTSSSLDGIFTCISSLAGDLNIGNAGNGNIIGTSGVLPGGIYPIQITKTGGAGGQIIPVFSNSSNTVLIEGNTVGGISCTGEFAYSFLGIQTSALAGIYTVNANTIGSTLQNKSILLGNVGSASSFDFYGIYIYRGSMPIISNNTISNIYSYGIGGNTRGIYFSNTQTTSFSILDNTIHDLTTNSSTGGTNFSGIHQISTADGFNISGNTIYNLTRTYASGSISINGIYFTGGTSLVNTVEKNLIYDFEIASSTGLINGIYIAGGLSEVSNNMIRLGLKPDGTTISQVSNIKGIYDNNSTDNNTIFHNSIYLGGVQNTPNESACIEKVNYSINDIRNNIFVNDITGTGINFSVIYNITTGIRSDYNIYWTNGSYISELDNASIDNLRYHQTFMPLYGGLKQDLHSGFGKTLFINPTGTTATLDLHLLANSSAEKSGDATVGVSQDIDNEARAGLSPVDIGADATNSTLTAGLDIFAPTFVYTPLALTTSTADRTIDVTIKDQGTGVPLAGLIPRIYYRRAGPVNPTDRSELWTACHSSQGVLQSGDGILGVWRFTIAAADFSPALTAFDLIEYFFVAEDQATTPNIGYSNFDQTTPICSDVNTITSYPTTTAVEYYVIDASMSGTYDIGGVSPAYFTLTGTDGFFENINSKLITGNVTAIIHSDITEPGSYQLKAWNEDGSGPYTVSIVPADASLKTLTCNNGIEMIRLEGVQRATFDGSFGGSGNYLKFVNSNTNYAAFRIMYDASNNFIKNCIIESNVTLLPRGVIFFDGGLVSGNNGNTISGNLIKQVGAVLTTGPDNGILSLGFGAVLNSGNIITNNEISNFTNNGIIIKSTGNGDGWNISNNSFYYNLTTNPVPSDGNFKAISIQSGSGHTVSGNFIGGQSASCSGSALSFNSSLVFYGIDISGTNSGSNSVIDNNTIDNISLISSGSSTNFYAINVSDSWISSVSNNNIGSVSGITYPGRRAFNGISVSSNVASFNMNNNNISKIILSFDGTTASYPGVNFLGISYAKSSTGTASSVTSQGNIIKDIDMSGCDGNNYFYGIYFPNGILNTGTGNTIGDLAISNSIKFKSTAFPFYGIYYAGAEDGNVISNNTIAGISSSAASPHYPLYLNLGAVSGSTVNSNVIETFNISNSAATLTGIDVEAGIVNMDGNIFGNATVNNITYSGAADINGIYLNLSSAGKSNITNNTIRNIWSSQTAFAQRFLGIQLIAGNADITGNTISDIQKDGRSNVYGIYYQLGVGGTDISNNIISNINYLQEEDFYGIWLNSADNAALNSINGNTIKNVYLHAGAGDSHFYGIYGYKGKVEIKNNIIGGAAGGDKITLTNGAFKGIFIDGNDSKEPITGNSIINVELQGNQTFTGIDCNNMLDNNVLDISSNTIDNIQLTNSGTSTHFYGIKQSDATVSATVSSNTIKNITTAGSGVTEGLYFKSTTASTSTISDNTIQTITMSNIGSKEFYGINILSGKVNILSNLVGSTTDANSIQYSTDNTGTYGIYASTSVTNMQNNIVQGFLGSINSTNSFYGLYLETGACTVGNTTGNVVKNILNNGTGNIRSITITGPSNGSVFQNNIVSNICGKRAMSGFYVSSSRYYDISSNMVIDCNIPNTNNPTFTGIELNSINNATASSIQNNTIEGITLSGTTNTTFTGISLVSGLANIGTVTGNIIGSTLKPISKSGTGETTGILLSGGTANVSLNVISNISCEENIEGIKISGSGTADISGNFINNIKSSCISGLNIRAIDIENNSANTVSSNTINEINSEGSSASVVSGIYENGTSSIITKNIIYGIKNNSTSGSRTANGIILNKLNGGYVANNMISIGENDDTEYRGIWVSSADVAANKQIYFNSVYIGETATGGNSYAFLRSNVNAPMNLKNNILSNFRTGTGNHYSIANLNTTNWTNLTYANANNYYSATPTTVGLWGATDMDFDTWTTQTGEYDPYLSINEMPIFTDPSIGDLHIDPAQSCHLNSVAIPFASVTDDFDGDARNVSNPDIGADEFTPTGTNNHYVWRGWTSTDWDTDICWQCETAPTNNPGKDIIIPVTTNIATIERISPAATVITDNINIRKNAELIVNPDNSLTTDGDLTLDGTLRLKSISANGSCGSYIDNANIIQGASGNLTAERYVSGNQWHEITAPIKSTGGNATSALFTRNHSSGNFNTNFYRYDETFDLDYYNGAGSTTTTPTGSVVADFQQDSLVAGWSIYHNGKSGANNALIENKGYMYWSNENCTINFTGNPATGTYNATGLTLTQNDPLTGENFPAGANGAFPQLYDGWNFLGNPYPSSLDWQDITDKGQLTNVDGAVYVWDNDQYSGYMNGISVMNANLGRYIAPMQGFFVHVNNAAGGSVNINNTNRSHNAPSFLKGGEYKYDNLLKLKASANGFAEEIAVYFPESATGGFDSNYDILRCYGSNKAVPSIYTLSEDSIKLALNGMSVNKLNGANIPLGFNMKNSKNVTISVDEFNDFYGVHVYLEDKFKDTLINLRSSKSYTFDLDTKEEQSNRFVLHFNANQKPELVQPINPATVDEDTELNLDISGKTFIDPDLGDMISYTAQTEDRSELPKWLHFDDKNLSFYGIPGNSDVGQISVTIIATDMFGEKTSADFTIDVINVNDAPILINKVSDIKMLANKSVIKTIPQNTFIDIDKFDVLKYSAQLEDGSLLPDWINFNPEILSFEMFSSKVDSVNIKITATDLSGESASDIFSISVKENSISDLNENSIPDLRVYPNLTSGIVFIEIPENNLKNVSYNILDVNGKILAKKEINNNITKLDISKYASGTYFVQIQTGSEKVNTKVIKE